MPIELKKIPEKIPLPEPPSAFRWFITIVLYRTGGNTGALFMAEKVYASAWFWFCIFVIPLSTGLACYAFRLRAYENERDRVNYWNHLHQEQHDIQVKRGRRPAGLLGKAYITPIACNKLASALINHGSQLQSTYFAHFQQAFTTARLEPSTSHFLKEGYSTRLTGYIPSFFACWSRICRCYPQTDCLFVSVTTGLWIICKSHRFGRRYFRRHITWIQLW